MLRFLSRFRGSRAMLHSSTSSGGVTEFSVYKGQQRNGGHVSAFWASSPPRDGNWAGLLTLLTDGETEVQREVERARSQGPSLQATQCLDRALETGICLLATRLSLNKLLYLSVSFFLNCKMGY